MVIHKCTMCPYTTIKKCNFTRHLQKCKEKTKTKEEHEFKCDFCNYATDFKYNLTRHLITCKTKQTQNLTIINSTTIDNSTIDNSTNITINITNTLPWDEPLISEALEKTLRAYIKSKFYTIFMRYRY